MRSGGLMTPPPIGNRNRDLPSSGKLLDLLYKCEIAGVLAERKVYAQLIEDGPGGSVGCHQSLLFALIISASEQGSLTFRNLASHI